MKITPTPFQRDPDERRRAQEASAYWKANKVSLVPVAALLGIPYTSLIYKLRTETDGLSAEELSAFKTAVDAVEKKK